MKISACQLLALVFATSSPLLAGAQDDCQSIYEIACTTDGFETLCELVDAADLDGTLSETTMTVFAPTNEAFEELDSELVDALTNDTEALTFVLTYHTISGTVVTSSDLNCRELVRMDNGKDTRTLCVGDSTFQKGAGNSRDAMPEIITTDISACNGVIHVVDKVILPTVPEGPSPTAAPVEPETPIPVPEPECETIAELACSNEDLSTLCFLLGEYNLTEALSGGQWTAFGPTNSAFEAIESVLPSLSDETISNILLFHTISDRVVTRAELECRGLQEMTTGEDSRTVCRDGRLYQKGAGNSDDMLPEIILGDLPACNGVVYVVDNVMLPQI